MKRSSLGSRRSIAILGRVLTAAFDAKGRAAVEASLVALRTTGRANDVTARLGQSGGGKPGLELRISASLFREDGNAMILVRLIPEQPEPVGTMLPDPRSKLLKLVESALDGCVVVDTGGAIVAANAAFRDMAQVATEQQVRGEPLERWVGRPGVDLDVLIANLRQHGSVRLFASIVRGETGSQSEVEISAVTLQNGGQPCYGLAIRNVGRRLGGDNPLTRELPRSADHLTELIGQVALKDLVREATDVIERLSSRLRSR